MRTDTILRLPLYSIVAGVILATVMLAFAMTGVSLPSVGLGALAFLPLSAALVDAIRLRRKMASTREGQGGDNIPFDTAEPDKAELQQWLEEKAETLTARELTLNTRALALQQWMQFPDAIDFHKQQGTHQTATAGSNEIDDDPMAQHDHQLFELIDAKTHELFDSIKQDAYRKEEAGGKVFDNQKIRLDLIALVADVAAIYRPGEQSPLLKTNVESVSRAIGRASLRLLVVVDNLPGGLARYDFQSIYSLVMHAVRTFGLYQSAKPYIDIASGMLVAGRLVSSTNPITLVAWWAASRATTYGASKLGQHVLNEQAVGMIRLLIEVVAVEVASIYSPMVRYRDVHWIYGVELVHLASELKIPDSARVQAMRELSLLSLHDEYGRVSLMRHLADGTTSRPANYHPAHSLSAADRKIVTERLEAFLLAHVINDTNRATTQSAIDHWQTAASERLEIQFHAGQVDETPEEQTQRAIWGLASFALQHLDDQPEQLTGLLKTTQTWNMADAQSCETWTRELQDNPPFLYHPPSLDPESKTCKRFLDDLINLAASNPKPSLAEMPKPVTGGKPIALPPWSGEEAMRVTAYFLRADATKQLEHYHQKVADRLQQTSNQKTVQPSLARALEYLIDTHFPNQKVRGVYCDATISGTGQAAHLTHIGSEILCLGVDFQPLSSMVNLSILARCELTKTKVEKIAGYVRNDCRLTFPDGFAIDLPGSTLRGYDAYFADLLNN